jgi:hypothetical protein
MWEFVNTKVTLPKNPKDLGCPLVEGCESHEDHLKCGEGSFDPSHI